MLRGHVRGQTTKLARAAILSLAMTGLVVCPLTFAQQMYKWVDEKGVTHYSETPPPEGAKAAAKIELKTPTPDRTPTDNWREREAQSKERRAKQGVQDEQARQQDERQRASRCRAAQRQADAMKNYARVFRLDDKGERVYLDDKERDSQLQEANREIARNCN